MENRANPVRRYPVVRTTKELDEVSSEPESSWPDARARGLASGKLLLLLVG